MRLFLFLSLCIAFHPVAASAEPISAAIVSVLGALGATVTTAAVSAFLLNSALSVGLSLLSQALQKRKGGSARDPGIRIEGTTVGEDVPQKFQIGRYLTGGHLEYHGSFSTPDGGPPNKWYARVFSLSDVPGVNLRRIMISDDWAELGGALTPGVSVPILKYRRNGVDYAYLRFYDGTQTAADQLLVDEFGGDPDQPWTADHIGTGVAYAILLTHVDREQFQGVPQCRFEMEGIPLYDPRKDTSAGGSGAHRHDDPSTWEPSENLAVQAYNLFRGIPLPDGNKYGGDAEAEDVPFSNWVAGMNECDLVVDGRPQFSGGLEINVDQAPADYIEELLAAGLGQVSEVGGVFRCRWGAPDTPILSFSDDDISISDPQSLDPFPGLEETYNAVRVTHPSPDHLWEPIQTPANYSAAWEAEDGGRRLPVQMDVPACFDHGQAQQIASGYALDHRRWRRHTLTLPPDAFDISALDSVSWTSERNGYAAKIFEVVGISYRPFTLFCDVQLRERDPSDYSWSGSQELPAPPIATPQVGTDRVVEATGWSFSGVALQDDNGEDRRPAVRIDVVAGSVDDAEAIDWQVELSHDNSHVAAGTVRSSENGVSIGEGILPETQYRARIRLRMNGVTSWSGWKAATTPNVRIGEADLSDTITQSINDATNTANAAGDDAAQALVDSQNATQAALAANEAANAAATDAAAAADAAVENADKIDQSKFELGVSLAQSGLEDNFQNDDAWVAAYQSDDAARAERPTPVEAYPEITQNFENGVGGFIRFDGQYRVISERFLHPLTLGRTWRIRLRMRYSVIPTTPVTRIYLVGSRDGVYTTFGTASIIDGTDLGDTWKWFSWNYLTDNMTSLTSQGCDRWGFMIGALHSSGTQDGQLDVSDVIIEDVTEVSETNANLSQNYLTAVQTDQAIAAVETSLSARVDGVETDLSSNYYTKAQTDSAIVVSEETLQANIDTAQSMGLVNNFEEDGKYWTSYLEGPPFGPGSGGILSNWTFANSNSLNGLRILQMSAENQPASGNSYMMQKGVFSPVVGRKYRIRVKMYVNGSWTGSGPIVSMFFRRMNRDYTYAGSPIPAFQSTNGGGQQWYTVESIAECHENDAAVYWRAGFYVRNGYFQMDPGGRISFASVEVEDVTDVVDLGAQITEIKTLDINAMTGTSLANLLAQLNTDGGGNSATVTSLLQTQSDVDGFASAYAGITAETSGGNISGFRANSWDNPDGTGGATLELYGDVLVPGSLSTPKLVITDLSGNLLVNGDMFYGDRRGWGSLPVGWSLVQGDPGAGNNAVRTMPSKYAVQMPPSGSTQRWHMSDNIPIDDQATYAIEFDHAGTGNITEAASVQLILSCSDAQGNYAGGHFVSVDAGNIVNWSRVSQEFIPPAGAAEANVSIRRIGGVGSNDLLVTNMSIVKQKPGTTLITPNSITAPLINVDELSAITANIGHFKSATSGERVEIEDDRIRVFDNSGTARIVIGRLN